MLLIPAILLAACSQSPVNSQATPTASTRTSPNAENTTPPRRPAKRSLRRDINVRYSITGSQTAAHIVYVQYAKDTGKSQFERVRLPWKQSFQARRGEFLYVSGQNTAAGEWLACEIRVEGRIARRMRAKEANQVAVCSMNLPKK